jgi:ribosomal protein L18
MVKPIHEGVRHAGVRQKVSGQTDHVCVFRGLTNIYAQVIDDVQGNTWSPRQHLMPKLKTA